MQALGEDSVVVEQGLSCSATCEIFPDQGLNLCPLYWQADSYPLHHQGSPLSVTFQSSIRCYKFYLIRCWVFFSNPINILNFENLVKLCRSINSLSFFNLPFVHFYERKRNSSILLLSVTLSCLTLQTHGLQHARLPCPSSSPRVCSNLCPLSWWCHPTISSSVTPFSSCLQSFPASGSFPISFLFASSDQSIGASTLASVFPMNIQCWFPLGLTALILLSKGPSRVFSTHATDHSSGFFSSASTLHSSTSGALCFSGKNTVVSCHFLLQGIFPTQG